MKTDYAGIDYSHGKSNVDGKGFHYGVINYNVVGSAWYEEAQPNYGEFDHEDEDYIDPISWYIDYEDLQAECSDDYGDIFITKSPYYTWCQYCSPCAPGAGYLVNWTEEGVGAKAYCFDHDWFDSGKAPYPVYRVSDGSFVAPDCD